MRLLPYTRNDTRLSRCLQKIFCLFVIYNLAFSIAFAVGSTGWQIFRSLKSSKPKPVTSVASVRGDISGVIYNPAVLATVNQKEIFTLGEIGLIEDKTGGILYAHPLNKFSLCIGIATYDSGKTQLEWFEQGKFYSKTVTAQSDKLGLIAFGSQLTKNLFAGLTLKYASSEIAEISEANATAVDVGMLYFIKVGEEQKIALTIAGQNLGRSSKFLDRAEKLPASLWFGAGYMHASKKGYYFITGSEVPYIIAEQRILPSVGIEFGKLPVAIFVDYRFGEGIKESLFSVGAGISIKNFDFNYAFSPATWLSPTHRISFGIRFGKIALTD